MDSDEQRELDKVWNLYYECAELNNISRELRLKHAVSLLNAFIEDKNADDFKNLKAEIIKLFIESFKEAHPDEYIEDWVKQYDRNN